MSVPIIGGAPSKLIVVNAPALSNAESPIEVTVAGMSIEVMLVLLKARAPIDSRPVPRPEFDS